MNLTGKVIRYLKVVVKFAGWRVDQPIIEMFLFDADSVAVKIPVKTYSDEGNEYTILKEYKLWQLSEVLLLENPHILKSKLDIIDAWVWQEVISKHPRRNKVLDYRLGVYEDMPVPKEIKYDSLLDDLL